jgi:nucleoside-diphosphate-sugar epimerase
MKALITGAAGFIGSHLTEACLRRGWDVVAIDALTTYYSPTLKVENAAHFREHERCTFLEADLLEVDLGELMGDTDVVFHLAAQAGVRASWGLQFDVYTKLNVTLLQRLLEAARDASLKRFVFASSSSVYGDAETLPTSEDQVLRPLSPYGATKALGEHLLHLYFRNYGIPTVALRYFSVYGPRQRPDMAFHRIIECALAGEPFPLYGDGRQTRDFTYVADVVDATIAAAERSEPGAIYNIGGGARISMREVLDMLRAELGALTVVEHEGQLGDAHDTAADISRAAAALGYAPSWDVPRGLREQAAWHRERRPAARAGVPVAGR